MLKCTTVEMNQQRLEWLIYIFNQGQNPLIIQFYMFKAIVTKLGTDEQRAKWVKDINDLKIHGAYCQTELGHGSNIQGLETTATLDMDADEIVLNSPTITSTKFWPGELGFLANTCVVVARLIINGEDKGVQSFFTPIRDDNHDPFPGVEVGDIGPKLGYNMKDNGFLRFNNY